MREWARAACQWLVLFARLAFALFVCLPFILIDEKVHSWRMRRRGR